MASEYKVVNLDEYRAAQRQAGGPGRPRKYSEDTVSVSFRVPESHVLVGRMKAHLYDINMTELMAFYYLEFLTRPIEETRRRLERFRASYGTTEREVLWKS